jgi:hypothetical protein
MAGAEPVGNLGEQAGKEDLTGTLKNPRKTGSQDSTNNWRS